MVPQLPQFAGSRVTSTQAELQLVMHAVPQLPDAQRPRSNVPVAVQLVQVDPQALAKSGGTHSPLQKLAPAAQVKPQLVPLQFGVEPAGPVGHAVHELPQLFTSVFDRHWLPHLWKPVLQVKSHAPPTQAGTALVTAGHERHEAPHWVVLVSATHAPPQLWNPVLQAHPQVKPSQVRTEFAGPVGHGLQLVPQAATLVLSEQTEPQRCEPPLHTKSQATPLQVEVPLNGALQGVHEVAPHELTLRFDTHAPAQPCEPVLQLKPHEKPSQVAVALAGGTQAEHELPHELMELFETHTLPQR